MVVNREATEVRDASAEYVPNAVKPAVPREYKHTEVGLIPIDWGTSSLLMIADCLDNLRVPLNEAQRQRMQGDIPYCGANGVLDHVNSFVIDDDIILIAEDGGHFDEYATRPIAYRMRGKCWVNNHAHILKAKNGHDQEFLFYSLVHKNILPFLASGTRAKLNKSEMGKIVVPAPPTEAEQRAIATALSDVDALLEGLDRLIAKKRDLKQAAMQQLLTGQTRLPEFEGDWEFVQLGEISRIKTGKRNNEDKKEDGEYPFFVRSAFVERIDSYSYDCEAILVPGEGNIGNILHYVNGRFDVHQRVYAITQFRSDVSARFLHAYMSQYFGAWAFQNTVKATVDSLRLPTFQTFQLKLPPTNEEQVAIAGVLTDMDTELDALEQRRAKTAALKQAMMQELLTGKTRLIKSHLSDPQVETASSKAKGHNWAINEAVVIAVLAKHFGREDHPLGRTRYTKLSYLLHRRVEQQAEGYLKKAAGPYNPQTKYGGPEKIAKQNGYIKQHKGKKGYSGFIVADNISQAEGYFEKWYGPEILKWLEQFRFKTKDELEVLTTVDMAAVELRASGKSVDVAAVKHVIASHPEWEAKLDRPVFSDANIAEAIKQTDALLGSEIAGGCLA